MFACSLGASGCLDIIYFSVACVLVSISLPLEFLVAGVLVYCECLSEVPNAEALIPDVDL